MAKAKSKAVVKVPDGQGSMTPVTDHRFDQGAWSIRLNVPSARASTWMQYFSAECTKRDWSSTGTSQIEASENSGSLTVTAGTTGQIVIAWERKPDGPLRIRAKSELALTQAKDLFEVTEAR